MKKILFLLLIFLPVFSCSQAKYHIDLSIISEPTGAEVYVNDGYVGLTPLNHVKVGILSEEGIPVTIKVEKEFYFPHSEIWEKGMKNDFLQLNYHVKLEPGNAGYTGDFINPKYEVEFNELFAKSKEELLLYKYEIIAKYGATFSDKEIQNYFDKKPWYKKNPKFKNILLSTADKLNIKLIDIFLNTLETKKKDTSTIIDNVEYISIDRSLQFVSDKTVLEIGKDTFVEYSAYSVQYLTVPRRWHAFGPLVFVEQVTDYFNVYQIDHATRKIEWFKEHVKLDAHSQACLLNNSIILYDIFSSGYLKEQYDRDVYHPVKVFDGKAETAWLENLPEFGKDAYVGFTLNHEIVIDEVRIKGGYFDPQYYSANNRLKKIMLYYRDDNSTRFAEQELTLKDEMEEQRFTISATFMESFELLIKDAYLAEGQEWNDTAISEISFYYKGKKIEIGLGEFAVFTEVDPE